MIKGKYYRRATALKRMLQRSKYALRAGRPKIAKRIIADVKKELRKCVTDFKKEIHPYLMRLYRDSTIRYEVISSFPRVLKMDTVLDKVKRALRESEESESSSSFSSSSSESSR